MKKIFIFTTVAVIIFSACKKEASTASQSILNATNSSDISAATPYRWDFTGYHSFNDCTGQDMVCLQGTASDVTHLGGVQANHNFHTDNTLWQAADGTGPIYHGTGSPLVYSIPHQTVQYGIQDYTINYQDVLTTAGGGNNLVLHLLIHVTVNANEITTVSLDNFEVGCQ